MRTIVKSGQTLADIAIQEFGSWTAIIGLATLNGMSMTDIPEPGTELKRQEKVYNQPMADYCRRESVSPATAAMIELNIGVFDIQFTEQFA